MDKLFQADFAAGIANAASSLQGWYPGQLDGATIILNNEIVEQCQGTQPESFFQTSSYSRVFNAVQACFPQMIYEDPSYRWVIYADVRHICNAPERLGAGGYGVTIMPVQDLEGLAGRPVIVNDCGDNNPFVGADGIHRWIGGLGHELGHALGLSHPPGCEQGLPTCDFNALMWAGYASYPNTYLRTDEKLILLSEPFFGATSSMPGPAAISNNAYGPLSVSGGVLTGNSISNLQPGAVIQLGSTPGTAGSFIEIDFQGFNLAPGNSLTIRSGAAGQGVHLSSINGTPSSISGPLVAQGENGAAPPYLYFHNPSGATVNPGGMIAGAAGATVDTLDTSFTSGQPVTNNGVVDGGSSLTLLSARITGGGAFIGNLVNLFTYGNANNPVNGSHYLDNGLQLYPSSGGNVGLTIGGYGPTPQIFNLKINGDASVAMPSIWPSGFGVPPNNAPVALGATRPAGATTPSYGGGSMIVHATGAMTLVSGDSNDFVFPGGIVLISAGTLDLNGLLVNQGWTTTGQPFQGIYFESPNITSAATASILSNDRNWTNFSTFPTGHFQISRLVLMPDGTSGYLPADADAPHQNTYSLLIETAAVGQCWTCLVNFAPINVQ